MPTNVLQRGQQYPELGYRIDGEGIAYDLKTGQSLSRQEVDARIAQEENVDPTTDNYAARVKRRGGINGFYDRNKSYIVPVADVLATTLTGGVIPPGVTSAAIRGLDQEGNKFGRKVDLKDAALGYVEGYGANKLAGAAKNMLASGAATGPTLGGVGSGTSSVANANVGSSGGGILSRAGGFAKSLAPGGQGGLTAADWLKAISGGVGAGLDYKTAQGAAEESKNRFARTQGQSEGQTAVQTQQLINRAPMADQAQALLRARMGAAPTTFTPRDFTRTGMTPQAMAAPATGGPQDQLALAGDAATAYRPGQGGVDTSALEMLKRRMLQTSGMRA